MVAFGSRHDPQRLPGALVLGGDYRALGVVRSLGRHGIPVWVLRSREDHGLATTSRYCRRRLVWPDDGDDARASFLARLARTRGLAGWVLFPTADATAAFVARRYEQLSTCYRVTSPPWEIFRWAYDKRHTAELAARLGVDQPRTSPLRSRADAEAYGGPFPVVLKPATKPRLNRPAVKAWRADDHDELLRRYDEASVTAEPGTIVLQELIPGDREVQFSFAAVCDRGRPLVTVTAERVRQYPLEFGRSSTFVQTVHNPRVEELGRRVLCELGISGPVEVEFKRDPRDDSYRLLDINARVWGWHTLGRCAGVDIAYLAWRLAVGRPVEPVSAAAGLAWLRLTTDLPAGISAVRTRRLSAATYLRSLVGRHERPVLAADDPVPALVELPLFALSLATGKA